MFQVEISHFVRNDNQQFMFWEGVGFRLRRKPTPSQLQTSLKVRHSAAKQGIFSKLTGQQCLLKCISDPGALSCFDDPSLILY